MEANIKDNYHLRLRKADHNFDVTLPKAQSDLAIETIKNPYYFDFLGLGEAAQERDIEKGLIKRITEFMIELGKGFAYLRSASFSSGQKIRSRWNIRCVISTNPLG